jgi:hypothetical protein
MRIVKRTKVNELACSEPFERDGTAGDDSVARRRRERAARHDDLKALRAQQPLSV